MRIDDEVPAVFTKLKPLSAKNEKGREAAKIRQWRFHGEIWHHRKILKKCKCVDGHSAVEK
jgi:hypothetical protein